LNRFRQNEAGHAIYASYQPVHAIAELGRLRDQMSFEALRKKSGLTLQLIDWTAFDKRGAP
jgi:hypothetical protein